MLAAVDAEALQQRLRLAGLVLRIDAITAEVVGALKAAGVRPILLKGPAVARWLYDEVGDRQYADTDLLVARDALARAEQVLSELGFTPAQRGWLGKSREWRRGTDMVDLHSSLFGIEASDTTAWTLLSSEVAAMEVGGTEVHVLAPAARALHLATHAAQHEAGFAKPQRDLERALAVLPPETWSAAADLAQKLGATGTFVGGLRRADGERLLHDLGLSDAASSPAAFLLASDPPPGALGLSQLAAATSMRGKLEVLARGVVPRPQYMRREYDLARRGSRGLAAAYIVRIALLAWHLPDGLLAWRRARRRST